MTKGFFVTANGTDVSYVNQLASMEEDPGKLVSYVYENAASSHLAAQLEGSGGIVCPIRYDREAHTFLEDIIKEWKLSTILKRKELSSYCVMEM